MEFNEQRHLYEAQIAKDPDNALAHFRLAVLFHQNQEYSLAKQHYECVQKLAPHHADTHGNLGIIFIEIYNNPVKGRQLFEKSLQLDPTNSNTLFNMGRLLSEKFSEHKLARSYYEKSLINNPKDVRIYRYLGISILTHFREDYKLAREYFEKALSLGLTTAEIYFNLGLIVATWYKEPEVARTHFEEGIKLNDNDSEAHFSMANILAFDFKDYILARKHLKRSLSINPEHQESKRLLQLINKNENDHQRAYDLRNEVRKQKHPCYNPYCPTHKDAIKSHILQQKGILDHVTELTKAGLELVELRITHPYEELRTNRRYYFANTGARKSNELAYWGFCDECDRELFSSLEIGLPDLENTRNQLLLSYRAFLNELFKQEYNVLFHIELRKDNSFTEEMKETYKQLQINQSMAALLGYSFKRKLELDLFHKCMSPELKFIQFKLPKVAIAASAIYSEPEETIINSEELLLFTPDFRKNTNTSKYKMREKIVFLHLIPRHDYLLTAIAYTRQTTHILGIPVSKIEALTQEEKFKLISDIIITRLETWCISPSIHQKWVTTGKDSIILDTIQYHLPHQRKNDIVNINIFEDLY